MAIYVVVVPGRISPIKEAHVMSVRTYEVSPKLGCEWGNDGVDALYTPPFLWAYIDAGRAD